MEPWLTVRKLSSFFCQNAFNDRNVPLFQGMPGQCSALKQNVNNFSPLHNMTVKARIWLLLNVSSLMTNEMFHTWSSSGIQSTIRFFLSVWSLVLTDYIYYWKLSDVQCTDQVFEQWVFSYVKWDWFSAWRFSNIWDLITMSVGKSPTAGRRLSDRHRRFNLGLQYYNDSGRSLNPPGNLTLLRRAQGALRPFGKAS